MFGIAIYSTITVLPLFYQELLGYPAFTAGLVVGPRGLGSIIGMPVIGYLGSRLDTRYLLTFGFIVFGIMSLVFGNVNTQSFRAALQKSRSFEHRPHHLALADHHHWIRSELRIRSHYDAILWNAPQ